MLQLIREAQLSFLEDFQNDMSKITEKILNDIVECHDKLARIIGASRDSNAVPIRGQVTKIVTEYRILDSTQDEILKIYQKYTEILRKSKNKG